MSSDDETTIASFPSGSTYFSNDNEVNININNLWNTMTSSDFEYIHSPRTRSAAKDSREYNSGCELYIRFRRETEKYKNIEGLKRNCIHESDCCACYDQVYAYTISTITLSCNYRAIPSCVGVHNLFYLSSDLPLSCIQFEFVRSDIITSENI